MEEGGLGDPSRVPAAELLCAPRKQRAAWGACPPGRHRNRHSQGGSTPSTPAAGMGVQSVGALLPPQPTAVALEGWTRVMVEGQGAGSSWYDPCLSAGPPSPGRGSRQACDQTPHPESSEAAAARCCIAVPDDHGGRRAQAAHQALSLSPLS